MAFYHRFCETGAAGGTVERGFERVALLNPVAAVPIDQRRIARQPRLARMLDILICLSPLVLLLVATRRNLHRGINLADEGYLVYGTQEVLRGKVPIRDFRAYDPARYYWCAAWCRLIGSEFIAVRLSMAAVSAMSMCLVSLTVFFATGSPWFGAATAATSLLWMCPRHKQIEHFFSLICCTVMFKLLEGTGQAFWLGALGALGAAFGVNILAYFIGASIFTFWAIWVLNGSTGLLALPAFLLGLGAGLTFLVLSYALIPGFLERYFNLKVLALLRRKTTNLALPKPWLWRRTPQQFAAFSDPSPCGSASALYAVARCLFVQCPFPS